MVEEKFHRIIRNSKRHPVSIAHPINDLIDCAASDVPSGVRTQEIEHDNTVFQSPEKLWASYLPLEIFSNPRYYFALYIICRRTGCNDN